MPLVRAWKLSHRNVGTNSATLSNGHQTQRSLINMASPVTPDFANGNKPMRSWVPGSYALGLLPGFQGSWSPKSPLGLSEDEVGCRTGPLEALISIKRVYKAQLVSEPFNLGTTRLFRSPMWVPHMRGWIISWDTYLWLDSWILVSLLLFSPPKISWMILSISLLYVFLWNTFIYSVVTHSLFLPWYLGKYLASKSPRLVRFEEALESFAWRTHLFLRFNTKCWEHYLFIITSFITPINTFLVHYTILGSLLPMCKLNLTISSTVGFSQEQFESRETDWPLGERR